MTAFRGVLGAVVCVLLAGGCGTTYPATGGADAGQFEHAPGAGNCSSLFDRIIDRERTGDASGAINAELDTLGDQCPSDYDAFVDYVMIKSFADIGAGGRCAEYRADAEPAAIRLARRDGFCSGSISGNGRTVGSPKWTCTYQPTYNNDWHDDVVCSNGTEHQRPYLRGWDNFVTETEIMESAREYEAQLNGR